MGFYELTNNKSKTLFDAVKDIFARFDFQCGQLRGQCYDEALTRAELIMDCKQKFVKLSQEHHLYVA